MMFLVTMKMMMMILITIKVINQSMTNFFLAMMMMAMMIITQDRLPKHEYDENSNSDNDCHRDDEQK